MQDKFETKPRLATHCNTVVGKHFLNSEHETDYFVSSIREFIVHSAWNPKRNNYDGDIAIAVLETPITFQHNIKPICLPSKKENAADIIGKSGVVAGWGYSDKRKSTTGIPKIVEIPITTDLECVNENSILDTIMSARSFCSTPNISRGPCKGKLIGFWLQWIAEFF